MKIVIKEGVIEVDGVKKGTFDPEAKGFKQIETYNGGEELLGDLTRELKESAKYGWKPEDLSDKDIKAAKSIWEIIPEAPRPDRNLGESDPIVSRYVEKEYPQIFRSRYPKGHYDFDEAGCGENLSSYRDNDLKPTPEALERLRGTKQSKVLQAERYLEMVKGRA